ncbi:MAG: peptidoglycan-binding protein [Clostridia bacterium]|nr:peptidoglycan-binding protein [Clostridia bacterium]
MPRRIARRKHARAICCGFLAVFFAVISLSPTPALAADVLAARCNVRLRKTASSSGDILATIPGGTEIQALGRSGGWTKTTFRGHTGFVSTEYLMEKTNSGYYPLREGDDNPYVREVKKRLADLGYLSGKADNVYNAETKKAVTEFQRVNGMKQDGIAGGETQRMLFSTGVLSAPGAVQTDASGVPTSGSPVQSDQTAVSSAPTAATLKKGDTGEDVKLLQSRLIELSYLSGRADGIFGIATERAVQAFQKRSSLTADGKAGKATLGLLFSNSAALAEGAVATPAPEPSASPAPVVYKTLKRGITSSDVKKLQERLKELGYFSASATGYYGSATQTAVEKFQKANKLKVDGIAGSDTQNVLFGTNAGKNQTPAEDMGSAGQNYPTLREGMKSTAVTTMQKKLIELGYLKTEATGLFGSATKTAVIAFQKANKLTADGVAGVQTLSLLYGNGASGTGSSSGGAAGTGGAGKVSGPGASAVKLLHWFNNVKPSLKSNSIVQVYDPATGYGFKLKGVSLGNHFDSEPLTANDTLYMNAAFGGITTWNPKPVWIQLPSGTWTLATMHNTPHLTGGVPDNNFNGHLCVHFLRDLDECGRNDPNYGMQHQRAIRDAWQKLTGQVVN